MTKKSNPKHPEKNSKAVAQNSTKKLGSILDRSDHRVPIQLLVDYNSGGNFLFDFCRDLGTGGVFIETAQPLATGSEIELTFTIPDSKETLRTSGKVIWSQGPIAGRGNVSVGMGIQFSAFNNTQRKTLDQFISRYGGNNVGNPGQRTAS
jgi:uncharacterized protein (TIGR02266 family)